MITRRTALTLLAAASTAGLARPALAEAKPIRIGYQKNGVFLVAKTRKEFDARFARDGVAIQWVEFSFGPPMLEALNVGAIDIATTGDSPPIFAQAAKSKLVYAAAQPKGGSGSAIILPKGSTVQSLAELKGKRIAIPKGSSAHSVAAAAFETVGLTLKDVTPVYLAPADGQAAFAQGAVDAWSIWDPYYAIAEQSEGVRVLVNGADIVPLNSYILAARDFAADRPAELKLAIDQFGETAVWGNAHRDETAQLFADATKLPLDVVRKSVSRTQFAVSAMTPQIVAEQQRVADRFYGLGLIPRAIQVADAVWTSGA